MFFIILMMIIIALSSMSFLPVWMSLEISSLVLIGYSFLKGKSLEEKKMVGWKLFKYQVIPSIFFLFSVSISMISWLEFDPFSICLVVLALMVKTGVPPFMGWMMKMSEMMSFEMFIMMNTLNKIIPIWIISNLAIFQEGKMNLILLFLALVSSIIACFETSIRKFIILTSIMNMVWILLGFGESIPLGFSFMTIYFISLSIVSHGFWLMISSNLNNCIYSCPSKVDITIVFLLLLIMFIGFPPFILFYFKLMVSEELSNSTPAMVVILLWFSSIFPITMYLKLMWKFFPWTWKSKVSFVMMVISLTFSMLYFQSLQKNKLLLEQLSK